MSDFSKILDHPNKDLIITKLVSGDDPKDVSQWLKLKYDGKDETHLRLPATLLQEFVDKYTDQYKFLAQVKKDQLDGKLDKKVYDSLLNNKAWKERLAEAADGEIDIKKKIQQLVVMIEARAEQVFDRIQQNPGNFKGDYVLINYFDKLITALEKADKIVNERPDMLIQHNQSIYVIEQHSVAFQEAIKRVLIQLDPATSARFMELLNEELGKIKERDIAPKPKSIEERKEQVDKLLAVQEAEFVEDDDKDEE